MIFPSPALAPANTHPTRSRVSRISSTDGSIRNPGKSSAFICVVVITAGLAPDAWYSFASRFNSVVFPPPPTAAILGLPCRSRDRASTSDECTLSFPSITSATILHTTSAPSPEYQTKLPYQWALQYARSYRSLTPPADPPQRHWQSSL